MDHMKCYGRWLQGLALVLMAAYLAGCDTGRQAKFDSAGEQGGQQPAAIPVAGGSAASSDVGTQIHVGDTLSVSFNDLVNPIAAMESLPVKEDGTITLIYNKTFVVAGKTVGQVIEEIRNAYVPTYFVNMTPSVRILDRFYYVDGEVKSNGRQVYIGRTTVLQAIATAGGYTDYANKRKIILTRANGRQQDVNGNQALKHPELDLEIFPGDKITVKHRYMW